MTTKELATDIVLVIGKYNYEDIDITWDDFMIDLFEVVEDVLSEEEIREILNG